METSGGVDNEDRNLVAENEKNNNFEGKTLENFTMEAFKILVEATKCANKLPFGKNRNLYESCPTFHGILKSQENYLLNNLSAILKRVNFKGNIKNKDDDDKFEMIVDVNDAILDKVGIYLDKLSGIHKNPTTNLIVKKYQSNNLSWNKSGGGVINNPSTTQVLNYIFNETKYLEKPQLKFNDIVNNDPKVPFEPRIKYKHNSLKPLAILLEASENGECQYSHPYEFELLKFKPCEAQMKSESPKPYKSLDETPLILVTSKDEVSSMVDDLQKYSEISVDLEHHSYRSFQGFTCLMQISTRDRDYIIDTIQLRSDLQELNKVFTDPSVVKVFHGADLDVLWLQKDLSLYVVNMFDTHQAAKLLNYPNLSLAYLLHHYCNVVAQKHFQLADWRIRPLPEELVTYARQDTHYLLYIYDNLKNALIERGNEQKNLLESVILESSRICLKTYTKPLFHEDGYLEVYNRSKKLFDNRQKFALQKLFEWRDATARKLDESLAYVLPNHMMLNISEILPRESQGILACCNPVPLPVRQNLLHLHQIILKAREEPLVKPVLEEQRFFRYSAKNVSLDDPLHCPHDLSHGEEFRDDLPVLLKKESAECSDSSESAQSIKSNGNDVRSEPIVNVFETTATEVQSSAKFKVIAEKIIGSSPYSRYESAKKFSESVEAQNLLIVSDKSKKESKKPEDSEKMTREENSDGKSVEISNSENSTSDEKCRIESKSDEKCRIESKSNDESEEVKESKKRSSTESEQERSSKRLKKEKNLVENPINNPDLVLANSGEIEKIKNEKRRQRKKRQKQFVPFNYDSVNFEKYKKFAVSGKKKNQKIIRPGPKGRKKHLKISI